MNLGHRIHPSKQARSLIQSSDIPRRGATTIEETWIALHRAPQFSLCCVRILVWRRQNATCATHPGMHAQTPELQRYARKATWIPNVYRRVFFVYSCTWKATYPSCRKRGNATLCYAMLRSISHMPKQHRSSPAPRGFRGGRRRRRRESVLVIRYLFDTGVCPSASSSVRRMCLCGGLLREVEPRLPR